MPCSHYVLQSLITGGNPFGRQMTNAHEPRPILFHRISNGNDSVPAIVITQILRILFTHFHFHAVFHDPFGGIYHACWVNKNRENRVVSTVPLKMVNDRRARHSHYARHGRKRRGAI